jgi:serine/threonine protein kinase
VCRPYPIIHRDLKPPNLMLGNAAAGPDGQANQMVQRFCTIKIADFGLSRTLVLGRRSVDPEGKSTFDSMGRGSDDVYDMTGAAGSYRYMVRYLPASVVSWTRFFSIFRIFLMQKILICLLMLEERPGLQQCVGSFLLVLTVLRIFLVHINASSAAYAGWSQRTCNAPGAWIKPIRDCTSTHIHA